MANSQSKLTLQNYLDKVLPLGDVNPVLVNVSGYQLEPFVTICTDVYSDIVGVPFPHKWNEKKLPLFYSNSFQQDYALINADGTSFYDVEWLERGIVIEMTSTQLPKPWAYVETGRQLTQATGTIMNAGLWNNPAFEVNTFPNYMLYYGTWGAGDTGSPTAGNNPGPNSVYTAPLAAAGGQVQNPITQIIDGNGNLQIVFTYGTCGATEPIWPDANSAPGTKTNDGTTVWTVVDPNGVGIRILPVPSSTGVIFQFQLIGQGTAIQFTNLQQTLAPFPDRYEKYFRSGIIAQCYRYSPDPKVQAKFEKNYVIWKQTLNDLRAAEDREQEENRFTPERGIMGGGFRRNWYVGAAWPFQYPN